MEFRCLYGADRLVHAPKQLYARLCLVEERFKELFGKPKPRHMRDIGHLMKLIKAVALVNVWFRKKDNGTIVASQKDIDMAFQLWDTVMETQDLNIPPAVMIFYKNFILPAYFKKKNDNDYTVDMDMGLVGLSSQELSNYYLQVEETTLNDENLRKHILPQLVNSGMIAFEQPKNGDRRSKHIFPKWFPPKDENTSEENNVGETSGVVLDELPPDVYDLFFGKDKH